MAQPKPQNRDEWPRFPTMLDCVTVFGACEESSGTSQVKQRVATLKRRGGRKVMHLRDIGTVGSLVAIIVVAVGGGAWVGQTQATAQNLERQVKEIKQEQENIREDLKVINKFATDQAVLDQRVNDLDTRARRIEFDIGMGFERVLEKLRERAPE